MLRPRVVVGLLASLFVGVTAVQISSCTLDQYGSSDDDEPPVPCTTVADCDDKNPCTTATCPMDTRVCVFAAVMDGSAPEGQTASDCKQISCKSGVASEIEDFADVFNDGKSCTEDVCTPNGPTNEFSTPGDRKSVV